MSEKPVESGENEPEAQGNAGESVSEPKTPEVLRKIRGPYLATASAARASMGRLIRTLHNRKLTNEERSTIRLEIEAHRVLLLARAQEVEEEDRAMRLDELEKKLAELRERMDAVKQKQLEESPTDRAARESRAVPVLSVEEGILRYERAAQERTEAQRKVEAVREELRPYDAAAERQAQRERQELHDFGPPDSDLDPNL